MTMWIPADYDHPIRAHEKMPMLKKFIGARLRTLCEERGLSAVELCRRCGFSTATLACVMRGKNFPNVHTLVVVCKVLQIEPEELMPSLAFLNHVLE